MMKYGKFEQYLAGKIWPQTLVAGLILAGSLEQESGDQDFTFGWRCSLGARLQPAQVLIEEVEIKFLGIQLQQSRQFEFAVEVLVV